MGIIIYGQLINKLWNLDKYFHIGNFVPENWFGNIDIALHFNVLTIRKSNLFHINMQETFYKQNLNMTYLTPSIFLDRINLSVKIIIYFLRSPNLSNTQTFLKVKE